MEGKKDMKRYRSFSRNPIVRIVLALLLVSAGVCLVNTGTHRT